MAPVPLFVTTVIPTHNYAHFLPRAIDSVLGQTYPHLECVVVDDGSQDDTPAVLSRYCDKIRAIRKEGGGPSAARNTGILAARGDAVAFLDADDWWEPEKLAKQVAALEVDPALGATGCYARVVNKQGETARLVRYGQPGNDVRRNLRGCALRRIWVGGSDSGAVVRRRVFDEIGLYDESLRAAEDWDLWLRVFSRHRVRNVAEALTNLYEHGTGVFRNAVFVEGYQMRVFEKACRAWPDVFDARLRRRVKALILADCGNELINAARIREARDKYLAAVLAWPFQPSVAKAALKLAVRAALGH